ncbi:hypothetical protein Dimus_018785 [Dionaea muscipula]
MLFLDDDDRCRQGWRQVLVGLLGVLAVCCCSSVVIGAGSGGWRCPPTLVVIDDDGKGAGGGCRRWSMVEWVVVSLGGWRRRQRTSRLFLGDGGCARELRDDEDADGGKRNFVYGFK